MHNCNKHVVVELSLITVLVENQVFKYCCAVLPKHYESSRTLATVGYGYALYLHQLAFSATAYEIWALCETRQLHNHKN